MNRSLKLSMLLALALGSTQAAALELGQIQVKSALGQPLLAEIPVNPDSPTELRNLAARLASAADAAQAGVAAGPNVPLQFAVVDAGNGKKIIRITSTAPVNDPYLDLLVEVSSASGKNVREFTLLLDPPASTAAAPVSSMTPAQAYAKAQSLAKTSPAPAPASTQSSAPAPAPAAAPAPPPKPAPAPKPAAAPRVAANGSIGPVERGQTLSSIAHQTAPEGVDVNQMLLALKQANPDAFYRDNINALKTGAVLRVPTREEAQSVAVAAALAEVRKQNGDWRSGATHTPTTVADTGTRTNASSAPTTAGPAGDHLAVLPAKEGSDNAAGKGGKGDKAGKNMAALHDDLLRSQEALTSLQKQGDELKSRLKDLEDINGKNERLLSLKDNEIAELQRKLAEARKAAGQPAPAAASSAPAKAEAAKTETVKPETAKPEAAKPAVAEVVTTPATPASTPAPAAAAPAEPAHASTAAAAKPAPVAPAAKPASKPTAPATEEEPWYMQTWAWGAGAGAAVLLLLLGLRSRSRKPAAVAATGAATSSLADRFGTMPTLSEEGIDLDQDELLDQLAEHPDDVGLHLELVSLYYSRRDVEHFEAAAEAMHAHITDVNQPEWLDVVHMGEDLVPEHPLFAQSTATGAYASALGDDEKQALHHFDLGSYASEREAHDELPPIPTPPPAKHHTISEYHFDFDLTPSAASNGSAPTEAPPATAENGAELPPLSWNFVEREDELAAEESEHEAAHAASSEPLHEPVLHTEHELPPVHDFGHEHDLEHEHDAPHFSDDPVDTKLDLARAYLDMGDPDGAHAMLEEVLQEGTQMQKDVAKRLLDSIL